MRKLSKLLFSHRSNLNGYRIVEELGVVTGSCCQCGSGLGEVRNSVANAVGGQLTVAKQQLSLSVKTAMRKALVQAEDKGANCVVNLREQICTTLVKRIPFIPAWYAPPATFYFTHVTGTAVIVEKSTYKHHRRPPRASPTRSKGECKGEPPLVSSSTPTVRR